MTVKTKRYAYWMKTASWSGRRQRWFCRVGDDRVPIGFPVSMSIGFQRLVSRKPGRRTPMAHERLFTVISFGEPLNSRWAISQ